MNLAIKEAEKGNMLDEVPIGAVLADNLTSQIISKSYNQTIYQKNATKHAEMLIIEEACKIRKSKYLLDTSIFITLEPCAMCSAAISKVKINKIYFGAYDEKSGALESIMDVYKLKNYFVPEVYGGINELECSLLIKNFFKKKRKFRE